MLVWLLLFWAQWTAVWVLNCPPLLGAVRKLQDYSSDLEA